MPTTQPIRKLFVFYSTGPIHPHILRVYTSKYAAHRFHVANPHISYFTHTQSPANKPKTRKQIAIEQSLHIVDVD
jgi:hypothetical protein